MKIILLSIPTLVLCMSCATLFSDKSDKITINSEPSGAEVFINGEIKGKTPLEINLERDTFKTNVALVKKKGYASQELRIGKTFNATTLINIGFLCSAPTSAGIDALTGALIKYSPTSYLVSLNKVGALPTTTSEKTLYVLVNEQQLRKDISRGEGIYLDGLFSVYKLETTSEIAARQRIFTQRERLLKVKNALEFSNAVAALLEDSAIASL